MKLTGLKGKLLKTKGAMTVVFILPQSKQKCEVETIKYLVRRSYLSICLLPATTEEYEIL